MPHTTRPPRAALALVVVLQLAWGLTFIARTPVTIDGARYFTLFDDAMISMRYARNLAGGDGLVWNPGDAPVEGYSNFLWTLWMAALHRVAREPLVPLLVALSGLVLLLVNTLVVFAIARRLAPDRPRVPLVAALMAAGVYSLAYWTLRGMEVGLLVLLIDVAVLGVLRSGEAAWDAVAAIAVLVLPLVRADGALPALAIAAYAALAGGARRRKGLLLVALPLVAIAAQTAFRVSYYGAWMPNTYYLKMTGAPLTARITRGVLTTALEGAWALWPIAVLAAASRPLSGDRRLAALVPTILCAYSAYVGGDAWEWTGHINRYVVCGLPLAIVLASIGLDRLIVAAAHERPPALVMVSVAAGGIAIYAIAAYRFFPERELSVVRPLLMSGVALAALGAAGLGCASDRGRFGRWHASATAALGIAAVLLVASGAKALEWIRYNDLHVIDDRFSAELGVRLRELTSPDARIAVVTAGAIPYFSWRWTTDLLGKNDAHIAHLAAHLPLYPGHDKWDYRYSVETWRPDVIVHLWRPSAAEVDYVLSAGYIANPSGILVRRDSRAVDGERLLAVTEDVERRHDAARAR